MITIYFKAWIYLFWYILFCRSQSTDKSDKGRKQKRGGSAVSKRGGRNSQGTPPPPQTQASPTPPVVTTTTTTTTIPTPVLVTIQMEKLDILQSSSLILVIKSCWRIYSFSLLTIEHYIKTYNFIFFKQFIILTHIEAKLYLFWLPHPIKLDYLQYFVLLCYMLQFCLIFTQSDRFWLKCTHWFLWCLNMFYYWFC